VLVAEQKLSLDDVLINYEGKAGKQVAEERDVLVALDTKLTTALEQEGLAREIIRALQAMRKTAGYAVTDRIVVAIVSPELKVTQAVKSFAQVIKQETLATALKQEALSADLKQDFKFGKLIAQLFVKK